MTEFHETRIGRQFYEVTLPKLVEQLAKLNVNLELIAARLPAVTGTAATKPPSPASSPDPSRTAR